MSRFEYGKEFLKLLDELEVTSPSEVLKETCVEVEEETITFISNTFVVVLGKYINSSKLGITTYNRYVDVIEKLKIR